MNLWNLGVDVSKARLDVALLGETGQTETAEFSNDRAGHGKLLRWLKKKTKDQPVHACLEATGVYAFEAAEALHAAGHAVSVLNPARPAAYAKSQLRRNKTDKLDAHLLAEFCRTQEPPLWTPPGPEFALLQALIRRLEDLDGMRQAETNRLEAFQRTPELVKDVREHIGFLEQQMEDIRREIDDHIDRHPGLKHQRELLASIPGVGKLTAAKLLSEVPNLATFENAKQLAAYAGLNPGQRQSGNSRKRSSISKVGNGNLRRSLYMPAIVAKRYNPVVRAFCQRLEEKNKLPMEQVVVAMRKLLHIAYGVIKNDTPFDPHWEQNHEKQAVAS
ncbi:MAG: IS110 family transposase [Anaerolineae bacterium]|nr:MAG: IS110 family transposase [Anaerolineae bacterium]